MSTLLDEFGIGDAQAREESWRYSKPVLRALEQQNFIAAEAEASLPDSLRERFEWPQSRGRRLVFVNGVFSQAHSDLSGLDSGIEIDRESAGRCVLTISSAGSAFLHLVYLHLASPAPSRWSAASEIRLQKGGATLMEHHLAEAGAEMLGALSTTVQLAAESQLDLLTLSELPESVSLYRRVTATVARDAEYRTTQVVLGGRLQRHDIAVELAGARSRHTSRGVFVLRGRQHADVQIDVRHAARDAVCDLFWRGVADQRARGVFRGAITVAEGADGSDAKLSNKNLLLSAHAEIDTQPALEIYADEVKAAHGATVGQLDERAVFYLRSRGIPRLDARRMMVAAFCREAIDGVVDEGVRTRLMQQLAAALPENSQ